MCGIAGLLNLDAHRPANAPLLQAMLDVIRHRGPDDEGTLSDREVALGMRRLSIIDLEGGKQPIYDETGRFGVVFNGEIYNYRELQAELRGRGHQLVTESDTEVIVHLYEELGAGCLGSLRGMFAIAIWDSHERSLFVARDRLGIKPLYHTVRDDTLIFGSEIKSVLCHPGVKRSLDLRSMTEYLALKYVPAPHTLFDGIQSLPPGHYLTCKAGRIEVTPYWDISFASDADHVLHPASQLAEYEQRLADLLTESVRLRLRSDVPFGAFLSGGLDSSLIVALMSQLLTEPVKTFSVGFEQAGELDELPFARQVAERFKTQHHEILVRDRDLTDHAESVLWHLDQPIADQATIATYLLSRLAAEQVKMVLTGEGGDELFAGYARYEGERFSPWTCHLPALLRSGIRSSLPWLPGLRRPKIALNALMIVNPAERMTSWFPLFAPQHLSQLLSRDVQAEVNLGDVFASFEATLKKFDGRDPLHRMLYTDSKLWLPDYLLLRGDKLTMAHSLEARVPLLDHKLVEFAATVPSKWKLHGRQRKFLLKRVATRWLPESIIHRKKQGFPIPLAQWLRGGARELMEDLLSLEALAHRGLFNPSYVSQLRRRHQRGYADHSAELWGLMSLEMWLRRFVDGVVMAPAETHSASSAVH